ncbi:MAG: hypothetical protein WAM73_19160 [Desulfobacterales bacterium]
MRGHYLRYGGALAGLLILLGVLPHLGRLSAAECQLVRIFGENSAAGNQIQLTPVEVAIPPDTCVVWINWVQGPPARIIFRQDAAACRSATQSPSGFAEKDTFFTTGFLPRGGTASLTFVKKGKFRYQVEIPDASGLSLGLPVGQSVAVGTLVVE